MKKCEILSVGTELLMGQVANTDAQYISGKLPGLGIGVYYHTVVGDNPVRVMEALNIAAGRADIIITTGGLGPTQDDLTKNVIADFIGKRLVRDENTCALIEGYFKRTGRPMTESNFRQAYFPEGAVILKNERGTAPGCLVEFLYGNEQKVIVMLPGPPGELIPMLDNEALPLLAKYSGGSRIISRYFPITEVPESKVESMLLDIIEGKSNPTAATYVKDGVVTVRATASGEDEAAVNQMLDGVASKVRERFGDDLISDRGEDLKTVFLKLCVEHGLKVAAAESLTAGLIPYLITSVPGASAALTGSFVTYSNDAKMQLCGVKAETLELCGAVSRETCREMLEGTSRAFSAQLALATTGNAGPGVMENKPAGLVYVGAKLFDRIEICECHFRGGRENVRMRSAMKALDLGRRLMLEYFRV
ncbi:MAG: competence/damage-inducible protein A [Clostridia bacterium]|nr:competence/damage-inducible protein A [Clostridia bacterium]